MAVLTLANFRVEGTCRNLRFAVSAWSSLLLLGGCYHATVEDRSYAVDRRHRPVLLSVLDLRPGPAETRIDYFQMPQRCGQIRSRHPFVNQLVGFLTRRHLDCAADQGYLCGRELPLSRVRAKGILSESCPELE